MNELEEQLINFETAKSADKKGFDIKCKKGFWLNSKYNKDGDEIDWMREMKDSEILKLRESNTFQIGNPFIYRPTQSLLQRWLREKHKILVVPIYTGNDNIDQFTCNIQKFHGGYLSPTIYLKFQKSYEEALEVGLQEGLKLIK